jgi:hypothetical protein
MRRGDHWAASGRRAWSNRSGGVVLVPPSIPDSADFRLFKCPRAGRVHCSVIAARRKRGWAMWMIAGVPPVKLAWVVRRAVTLRSLPLPALGRHAPGPRANGRQTEERSKSFGGSGGTYDLGRVSHRGRWRPGHATRGICGQTGVNGFTVEKMGPAFPSRLVTSDGL